MQNTIRVYAGGHARLWPKTDWVTYMRARNNDGIGLAYLMKGRIFFLMNIDYQAFVAGLCMCLCN
jgi:hypothetical protein